MFLVQRSIVRKSPDTAFYAWPEEYKTHFKEQYLDTKKSISSTMTKSADNLSLVVTTVWESQAAFEEFLADPVIQHHMMLRSQYNNTNDIVGTVPSKMEL